MINPTNISPYFQHSTGASNDPKMLAIISEFGLEGYARYFMLIELILQTGRPILVVSDEAVVTGIAHKLMTTTEELYHYFDRCCALDLFTKETYENERALTNLMLYEHHEMLNKKRSASIRKGVKGHE